MIENLNRLISILDTNGGHLILCAGLMITGHIFGEKEWSAAGLGGLLMAMKGAPRANP